MSPYVSLAGAGIVFGIWLVRHAGRNPQSLIDLSLLQIRTFRVNVSAGLFFRLGFGTTPFLLPLMFQVAFGMSAFASGLLTFASALGAFGSRVALSRLLKMAGYRNVLLSNGIVYAISVGFCAYIGSATPRWLILLVVFIGGVSRMLQNNSLNTLAYADVPVAAMSKATSLAQLAQQFGQALGVALSALMLQSLMDWRGEPHLSRFDFQLTFIVVAILSLFSHVEFFKLPKNSGDEISGRKSAVESA